MGEELDTDLSKEGWRRAAPNEVVWVDSLGNKALTASDLRRSTLRNHWGLAATRLTTGSHWNTTIDEDEGWGESKSSEPTDDSTSAEVWGSAPSAGWGSGGQALSNWEDSRPWHRTADGEATAESRPWPAHSAHPYYNPTVETHEELVRQGWAKAHDHRPTKRRRVDPWPHTDKNSLGAQ